MTHQPQHTTACAIWLTGLSGAGKTTIGKELVDYFRKNNIHSKLLDGDELRNGLNSKLGFSEEDRLENVRRTAEVAKLFIENNTIAICCLISPQNNMRALAKEIIGTENYFEIFVDTPFDVCEKRDVKGLYKKARTGVLKNFTGINSAYEKPTTADLTVDTSQSNLEEIIELILNKLENRIYQQQNKI